MKYTVFPHQSRFFFYFFSFYFIFGVALVKYCKYEKKCGKKKKLLTEASDYVKFFNYVSYQLSAFNANSYLLHNVK